MATMRPPPPPVDPALGHWPNTNPFGTSFESLLLPGTGVAPQTHERSVLTGTSRGTVSQPENFQLPAIRDTNTSPLQRFYNDPTSPWTPQRVNLNPDQSSMNAFTSRTPSGSSYNYHESPRSDMSASTNGRQRLDSGYWTTSLAGNSEPSGDRLDQGQSCPSVTGDFNSLSVNGGSSTPYAAGADFSRDDQSSSMDGKSETSPRPRVPNPLICDFEGCSRVSKNPSEAK